MCKYYVKSFELLLFSMKKSFSLKLIQLLRWVCDSGVVGLHIKKMRRDCDCCQLPSAFGFISLCPKAHDHHHNELRDEQENTLLCDWLVHFEWMTVIHSGVRQFHDVLWRASSNQLPTWGLQTPSCSKIQHDLQSSSKVHGTLVKVSRHYGEFCLYSWL